MNVSTETGRADELAMNPGVVDKFKNYVGGRRGLILLSLAGAGGGMYLGWGWLAAAGIAPLLLALAPCAAMCALGMCMKKGSGKSGSTDATSSNPATTPVAKPDEGN
jgi:hypothetical protein